MPRAQLVHSQMCTWPVREHRQCLKYGIFIADGRLRLCGSHLEKYLRTRGEPVLVELNPETQPVVSL